MKRSALILSLLLAWTAAAHACAVCGARDDRNQKAFLNTTILLSLLPLGMIGGGLWWLNGKVRERFPDEFVDRDALLPEQSPRD